ncbi:MAG TPA: ATP-binding protein [Acidimicrobiia bacterium]
MKRLRLASKLALAIVPIGLVALVTGALVSWTYLEEARGEERVSLAARVAADAMDALVAVSAEQSVTIDAALGDTDVSLEAVRNASDRALQKLRESVRELVPKASGPASGIASAIFSHTSRAQGRLEDTRELDPLSDEVNDLYDQVGQSLITVVSQSTLYFGDESRAREGSGAVALARASFASVQQERLMARFAAEDGIVDPEVFQQQFTALETTVRDWLRNANDNSPTVAASGLARTQPLEPGVIPTPEEFPFGRNDLLANTGSEILDRVAAAATAAAEESRSEAVTVASVVIGVLLVTVVVALVVGRSTVRRVKSVTLAARHVADEELPKLVDALANPTGQLEGSIPVELEESGPDEVGELARSFAALHSTLVEVANRQMEILRRGVSEIFVTLARRNGSLVDRQLALIDELESKEEDPDILDGYYRLDHLATRMRRNAESLLVLAGSESPRMWSEPLEMDDVVRAAISEVDEYQRIDVLALEPALLKGKVVTDLAHLMSELLDNATQFSPPSERVRVTGLFDDNGYVITIADSGLGMSEERMAELNRLIQDPPVLGLALEPTLGMYVVARLAARHGITVRLVPGVPGTTVRITLPRTLLETSVEAKDNGRPDVDEDVDVVPSVDTTPAEPKSAPIPADLLRPVSQEPVHRTESTPPPPASSPPSPAATTDGTPGALPRRPTPGLQPGTSVPSSPSTATPPMTADERAPRPVDMDEEGKPSLPTRRPGSSFRADAEPASSSAVSTRGADGIRSALEVFQQSRTVPKPEDGSGSSDREERSDT